MDRKVTPAQYWRVNTRTIKIMTPGSVSQPVKVDVFLPTGVDKRLEVKLGTDHVHLFVQERPEEWVVEEAMRYFGGVDV